jgi:hypothetical protein
VRRNLFSSHRGELHFKSESKSWGLLCWHLLRADLQNLAWKITCFLRLPTLVTYDTLPARHLRLLRQRQTHGSQPIRSKATACKAVNLIGENGFLGSQDIFTVHLKGSRSACRTPFMAHDQSFVCLYLIVFSSWDIPCNETNTINKSVKYLVLRRLCVSVHLSCRTQLPEKSRKYFNSFCAKKLLKMVVSFQFLCRWEDFSDPFTWRLTCVSARIASVTR